MATAAIAATLAATAADSLKAAGCEAPLAFEGFSGLQQEQQKGTRIQRGLYSILEGLRQLPTEWESMAPAAIAAARGYATPYPTAPDAAPAAPAASTAVSDIEVLLQEGAAAAKQLKKSWLGAQYVLLLQTETNVAPPQEQQQQLLQGDTIWRRSKRFLSSVLPLRRLERCKDSADSSSSSGNSNILSQEANNKDSGGDLLLQLLQLAMHSTVR
ncbi:uncharacterized protein EMH_0096730 [Eimeria mitis]|uniref:Uncharacterized protein n=1 Tax=Eimeria mitis TaxID=44415 RepID=U6KIR9_9EIME|nr:uncharacterized protein EMH_0096730 [Eimeria mitis]CDJ35333.1 hypothetical protein EMH_0096730 [Eimeria mitis]